MVLYKVFVAIVFCRAASEKSYDNTLELKVNIWSLTFQSSQEQFFISFFNLELSVFMGF